MRAGLPREYYERLHCYRRGALIYGLVLTAGVVATTFGAFFGPVPLVVPVLVSTLLLLNLISLLCDLKGLGVGNRACALVRPFFQERVNGPCTYLSGSELARNWLLLNSVALECGEEPLSSFGLGGESVDETPEWCDPAPALKTVAVLMGNVHRYAAEVEQMEQLQSELALLKGKLEAAQALGVLFCLHLSTSEWVCPQAELHRKGSYF